VPALKGKNVVADSGRKERLTVLDIFSGVGGFSLAFERHGFRTVAFAEIEPFPCRVLAHHWPAVPNLGDVSKIDGTALRGQVDVVTFGAPCQDLSIAGKRGGLAGERSGLFFDAVRIVAECGARFAVYENVPGLFSSNGGRDFGAVLDALANIGAMDLAWATLDAQWFGVPQRRRRVFVVADFRGERAGEILAECEGLRWRPAPRREARKGVAASVIKGAAIGRQPQNGPQRGEWLTDDSCFTLNTVEHHAVALIAPAVTAKWAKNTGGPSGDEVQNLIAVDARNGTIGDVALPLQAGGIGSERGRCINSGSLIVGALQSGGTPHGHGCAGINDQAVAAGHVVAFAENSRAEMGQGVRRLTPRECERLQGFPDDHTALPGAADGPRYRALGNSVAVPVVEWIARRMAAALEA
jgi:DNA (cytosine-5)-methyltransferase 1